MKLRKTLGFIMAALVIAACGTVKLLQPQQTDVERGNQIFANLTLGELNQGKAIYENACDRCHGLKKPESRNEQKWRKIVPVMVGKVNKKAGKQEITPEGEEILTKYLVTMSTAPAAN